MAGYFSASLSYHHDSLIVTTVIHNDNLIGISAFLHIITDTIQCSAYTQCLIVGRYDYRKFCIQNAPILPELQAIMKKYERTPIK